MPGRARYSLTVDVLTALLALSDRDRRTVYAAFEQLAEDPVALATAIVRDWDGRLVYAVRYGRFEIGWLIQPENRELTITLLLPSRS